MTRTVKEHEGIYVHISKRFVVKFFIILLGWYMAASAFYAVGVISPGSPIQHWSGIGLALTLILLGVAPVLIAVYWDD